MPLHQESGCTYQWKVHAQVQISVSTNQQPENGLPELNLTIQNSVTAAQEK